MVYDGDPVFERQYRDIPSFQQDPPQDEGTFAGMDSARFVANEWDTRPGTYSIEYKLSGAERFRRVDVGDLDAGQSRNVGVDMQLLGGGMTPAEFGVDVPEFDSETQASEFLATVTNETD